MTYSETFFFPANVKLDLFFFWYRYSPCQLWMHDIWMQLIYMFHFNSSLRSPLHYAKLPQKWSIWLAKIKFFTRIIFGGPIVFIQVSKVNTCNSCFFVFKHFYWGYVLNKISWINQQWTLKCDSLFTIS